MNVPTAALSFRSQRHGYIYREQEDDLGIWFITRQQTIGGRAVLARLDTRATTLVGSPCHSRWVKTETNGHYASSEEDDLGGLPRGRTVLHQHSDRQVVANTPGHGGAVRTPFIHLRRTRRIDNTGAELLRKRRTATWPEDLKAPTGDGQMAVKVGQPSGRPNRRYRRSFPTRIAGQTCHSPGGRTGAAWREQHRGRILRNVSSAARALGPGGPREA